LVRNLYNLGYNADEVREIFRFIDWMMSLREDLSRKFEQELTDLEESLNMPSVERIAVARGIASLFLAQLARTCGPLPEEFEDRVRDLPFESLQELAQAVFEIRSQADLQSWLDARDESP
jgi:hypothetical protein